MEYRLTKSTLIRFGDLNLKLFSILVCCSFYIVVSDEVVGHVDDVDFFLSRFLVGS